MYAILVTTTKEGKKMTKITDSKGNEIKVGSLVKAKRSSVVREVLRYTNDSFATPSRDCTLIMRAKRQGSHSQDWTWLQVDRCEVVG